MAALLCWAGLIQLVGSQSSYSAFQHAPGTPLAPAAGHRAHARRCVSTAWATEYTAVPGTDGLHLNLDADQLGSVVRRCKLQQEDAFLLQEQGNVTAINTAMDFWAQNGLDGSFTGAMGVPIRYRLFPQYSGDELQPGVLVLTGWAETMIKYAETVRDLHQRGWSVYTLDHQGQGVSGRLTQDHQVSHIRQFDHYVDDLLRFCREVVPQRLAAEGGPLPGLKLHVLAHSMGCLVGTLAALREPASFE